MGSGSEAKDPPRVATSRGVDYGAPKRIRTCGLRIRSPTLYPTELWARWRRGRDSNPGQRFCPCNRLAGGCLRPTRPPLPSVKPTHYKAFRALAKAKGMGEDSEGAVEAPSDSLAEGEGFEPPIPCGIPVFKTGAFNRSATPPASRNRARSAPGRPCTGAGPGGS